MSKIRYGIAALDAIQKNYDIFLERLIKGYRSIKGKEPEGLDLTMIKREAYQKAEDSAKVVDMGGRTLDPSKKIMGGTQEFEEGIETLASDRPFGDNIRDAYSKAGRSREEASEMIKAMDSPGAKKSYQVIEESLRQKFPGSDIKLFGDETFEEILQIEKTGKHPRMKATGGRVGYQEGGITDTLINAGISAFSGIPFLGNFLSNLNQNTFNNLPIGDQLFITEQMAAQGTDDQSGLNKDKYGYNIRSAFGNYGDLVTRRAQMAAERQRKGLEQRAIDDYYTKLDAERKAAEAEAQRRAATLTSQMAGSNRQSGTGGYQSSWGGVDSFMSGSGTAADMGSFANGGRVNYQAGGVATPEQYAAALAKV